MSLGTMKSPNLKDKQRERERERGILVHRINEEFSFIPSKYVAEEGIWLV
jgi:hypothetical protein